MFRPLLMQRLTLLMQSSDVPASSTILATHGNFQGIDPQPEQSHALRERDDGDYRRAYASMRARIEKILDCASTTAVRTCPAPDGLADLEQMHNLDAWLGDLWSTVSALQERMRGWREDERRTEHDLATLQNLTALEVDLTRLREFEGEFLDLQIGTVQAVNTARLLQAVELAGYLASPFLSDPEVTHLLIAGPRNKRQPIDPLLKAAGWRRLAIPAHFRDHPDQVQRRLRQHLEECRARQADLQTRIDDIVAHHRQRLDQVGETLCAASTYVQLIDASSTYGDLTRIEGWVPARHLPALERALKRNLPGPVVITARAPVSGETVPTQIEHHRLIQPFAALVANYGVPRYRELDPTLVLALTYPLMFGMMFGDIGHGAVIAVAGLLGGRWLRGFGVLLISAGLASIAFGAAYGSVFGFENVIHPLWLSPLSDPILMLTVALAWGVGFILLASIFSIYNHLLFSEYGAALCEGGGVAGIALYLSLLWLLLDRWRYHSAGPWPLLCGAVALAVMFGYQWHRSPQPPGERALIALMGGFETLMGYFSGSLSFLRVAAFSLNHVALSLAVFTIADGLDGPGHWLVIVVGNVFILFLEGAIVAIQVMRLEYYEGFSRFFTGDGQAFRALAPIPLSRA